MLVLSPALNTRVRTWTSDEDGAREAAQRRLDASIDQLAAVGVQAQGEIGDGDPVQAVEDALRSFPADEIVLSTHPPGRSHWLERGVVVAVRERFDVPVTHVVVDLERQTRRRRFAVWTGRRAENGRARERRRPDEPPQSGGLT